MQDFPYLETEIAFPTTELRRDIFEPTWTESDWVYPPVVGEKGYVGAATHYPHSMFQWQFDPSVEDASNVISFPLTNVRRSLGNEGPYDYWWLGGLANGTQLGPGKYKCRIAALMPFAAPEHANSWDIVNWHDLEVLPLQK